MRLRALLLGCLGACLLALMGGASAVAATTTTIGHLAPKNSPTGGCAVCTDFQLGASPGTGYTVPEGSWTLTSWSGEGGTAGGTVALRVFRPTGVPGQFRILATSATESIGAGEVPSFPVSIGVRPGDVIGILTGALGSYPNLAAGSPGDNVGYVIGMPSDGQTAGPGGEYPYGETERYVNVAATLTANEASLSVTRSGTGAGTVTSGPAGIDCGSTCGASFAVGDVLLAATPAAGSTFAGWSGAGCSGTGACVVSLAAPAAVDARFDVAATAAPATTPSCTVPNLSGATLKKAKRKLRAAHCGLGRVGGAHGSARAKAEVVGQHPAAGVKRPKGSKVAVKLAAPAHVDARVKSDSSRPPCQAESRTKHDPATGKVTTVDILCGPATATFTFEGRTYRFRHGYCTTGNPAGYLLNLQLGSEVKDLEKGSDGEYEWHEPEGNAGRPYLHLVVAKSFPGGVMSGEIEVDSGGVSLPPVPGELSYGRQKGTKGTFRGVGELTEEGVEWFTGSWNCHGPTYRVR